MISGIVGSLAEDPGVMTSDVKTSNTERQNSAPGSGKDKSVLYLTYCR